MPEIEAKFLVQDPHQTGRLLSVLQELGYSVELHGNATIVDRYFDTPDWAIFRAGWGCRLRDSNGEQTLTLKGLGLREGPIQVREEIEQRLLVSHTLRHERVIRSTGRRPVHALSQAIPSGPVRDRLAGLVGNQQTRELFIVRNQRSLYRLTSAAKGNRDTTGDRQELTLPLADQPAGENPASTLIELALDQVHITGEKYARLAPGALSFSEVELELKHGPQEPLLQLAELLPRKTALLPARLNKFQRGLQTTGLSIPTGPAPAPRQGVNGSPSSRSDDTFTPLSPTAPWTRLAYAHLARQTRILTLQQPRAWEGLEPEGVHQMRVALRHIRAALRVFRAVLPQRAIASLNAEFRWAARVLGEVRDLDVYRENLKRYMAAIPANDAAHLAEYERHLAEEWKRSRRRLIATFQSRRYTRLMDRFEKFVQRGPSAAALRPSAVVRICDAAAPAVDRNLKRLLRGGRAVEAHSPAELLHALRIRGKRLRYLLEFLRDVYKPFGDPLKRPIEATRQLQDVLGEHQDACVASARLRSYAQTVPKRKTERHLLLALGQLIYSQDQHAAAQHQQFDKVWRRFEKAVSRKRLAALLRAA